MQSLQEENCHSHRRRWTVWILLSPAGEVPKCLVLRVFLGVIYAVLSPESVLVGTEIPDVGAGVGGGGGGEGGAIPNATLSPPQGFLH